MKPIRLPDPCTLDEAAQWLSRESTQEWTEKSVLSRFLESDKSSGSRAFAPPTLLVVVGPCTELLDKENKFAPLKVGAPWLLAVTVPVDGFIHGLLLAGEAIPQGLATMEAPFRRYMVTTPIKRSAVRMPREWVEQLLPSFDALIYELNQGLHPELAREAIRQAEGNDRSKKATQPKVNQEDTKTGLWWQDEYELMKLAQNFGEELTGRKEVASKNKVLKMVMDRINSKEARKAKVGETPRTISITSLKKGPFKKWFYTPEE